MSVDPNTFLLKHTNGTPPAMAMAVSMAVSMSMSMTTRPTAD